MTLKVNRVRDIKWTLLTYLLRTYNLGTYCVSIQKGISYKQAYIDCS